MTKQEFYEKISQKLPIKREDEDFVSSIKQIYDDYLNDIKSIDDNEFAPCSSSSTKEETITKVKECTNKIQEIIRTYLDSCHSKAFSLLESKLLNTDGTIKINRITIGKTVDQHSYYYRARKDDGKINSYKQMFHVPNNKRGLIQTTRFSTPGYPCLYLGNTIYCCWEEMRRPVFDELCFAGFKIIKEFEVYNLLKPSNNEFNKADLSEILERLVYIIACQFTVFNDKDFFKPEYIIPQLILELIITAKRNKKYADSLPLGVAFTSTHLSSDFPYKDNYLKNIAIPVIDTTNEYCSNLRSLFEISDPVRYRFEELKERDFGSVWGTYEADKETKIKESYEASKMSFLERRLDEDTTNYNKL